MVEEALVLLMNTALNPTRFMHHPPSHPTQKWTYNRTVLRSLISPTLLGMVFVLAHGPQHGCPSPSVCLVTTPRIYRTHPRYITYPYIFNGQLFFILTHK